MERIGEEIQRELGRSGSRDAIPLAAMTAIWPEAVGKAVARNAWPLRLARDGTLHVAAASATWANELTLLRDEIGVALRTRLGDEAPSAIRFAVGPVPEPEQTHEHVDDTAAESSRSRRRWSARLRRRRPRSAIRSCANWSREPRRRA